MTHFYMWAGTCMPVGHRHYHDLRETSQNQERLRYLAQTIQAPTVPVSFNLAYPYSGTLGSVHFGNVGAYYTTTIGNTGAYFTGTVA